MTQTKLIPIAGVLLRTGLSRRTIYFEIANGRFPKPVQISARRVGWVEAEITAWIEARIAQRDGVAA